MTAIDATVTAPSRSVPRARFWEIDTLRGVAIVMMVFYHLLWDLKFWGVMPDLVLASGFWKYFQRTTASLFILLVGVSLAVSYQRLARARGGSQGLFGGFLRRGLRIFTIGVAMSLVIRLAGTGYVHFGVLHLIGLSIIVAYPFLRFKWLNLALWAIFFTAGYFIESVRVDTVWLVWLGLKPDFYYPVDYFPLIPWFGVVLLGIFLGNTLYGESGRRFMLPDYSAFFPFRFLSFLGRHSLLIYVIHQPLLLLLLALFGLIPLAF